jgi:hypothetical protein
MRHKPQRRAAGPIESVWKSIWKRDPPRRSLDGSGGATMANGATGVEEEPGEAQEVESTGRAAVLIIQKVTARSRLATAAPGRAAPRRLPAGRLRALSTRLAAAAAAGSAQRARGGGRRTVPASARYRWAVWLHSGASVAITNKRPARRLSMTAR